MAFFRLPLGAVTAQDDSLHSPSFETFSSLCNSIASGHPNGEHHNKHPSPGLQGYEQYLLWGLKYVNTADDRNAAWSYSIPKPQELNGSIV